jgi:hypothetical protein
MFLLSQNSQNYLASKTGRAQVKIPIKKYVMDESLSWEERYKKLDAHHLEETTFLLEHIKELEEQIRAYKDNAIERSERD